MTGSKIKYEETVAKVVMGESRLNKTKKEARRPWQQLEQTIAIDFTEIKQSIFHETVF